MKEKILEYIKNNMPSDGIDIATELKLDIADTYQALYELEYNDNLIKRKYSGMRAYYNIIEPINT